MKQDKNSGKQETNEYSKQFDDLLNQSSKRLTKEEQDFINRQIEAKRIADEQAQKDLEMKAKQSAEQKTQAFEDLIKGESGKSSKPTSEKNLQELFSDFYSRAKT